MNEVIRVISSILSYKVISLVANVTTALVLIIISLHQYAVSLRNSEPGTLDIKSIEYHEPSANKATAILEEKQLDIFVQNNGLGSIKNLNLEKLTVKYEKEGKSVKKTFSNISVSPNRHPRDRTLHPGENKSLKALEPDLEINEAVRIKEMHVELRYEDSGFKRQTKSFMRLNEASRSSAYFEKDQKDIELLRNLIEGKNSKNTVRKVIARNF